MMSASEAREIPLTTADALRDRVAELLGTACTRRLWLLFFDAEDRQLPALIPVDDYPTGPGGGAADRLAAAVAAAAQEIGAARVVVVWERRLGPAGVPADRMWAAAMSRACRDAGVALRAQLLCHSDGVRELTAAECGERPGSQTSVVSGFAGSAAHSFNEPS